MQNFFKWFIRVTCHNFRNQGRGTNCPCCFYHTVESGRNSGGTATSRTIWHYDARGLHCAPLAHETAGTLATGTLRFSFGWQTTPEEITWTIHALQELLI